MRTSLAFALVGMVAAAGCGDDNSGKIDASIIDARPIDAALSAAQLSLSPLTSDFGSVTIGQTSNAMTFTVTNNGQSASGSISASIMGAGAANFAVQTNNCTTLAAAATCTVAVAFTPTGTTSGQKTANLVVSASPGGSVSASLDGTAQTVGSLTVSPSTNAFGSVIVGSTSTSSATFTVTNPGGTATTALTTTVSGSDPNDFQKVTDTCNGQTLAPNATCTFTVNFKPQSAGGKSATFTVAAGTNSVTASATGTGVAQANIAINPSLQDFGTVTSGQSSGNVTFTVVNNGGSPTGALTQTLTGADASSFSVVSGNCAGTTLAPNATCNVILRFSPTSAGAKAAQFSVTGTPGGSATATLLGTGAGVGQLTITPSPVTYSDTTVGMASASQTFTVTNTGGSATSAIITALAGNDPSQFTIVAGSNGCQGTILQPNGTCTIAVTFTPTTGGAKSANLSASANTGGTATAGLAGNGIPAATFVISPLSHDFGAIGTGSNSSFFSFTVSNSGGQTTAVPNVALGGANASQFVLQNGCTTALAPNATCTVQVRFAPNINGNDTATVTVSGTPGGTATATVTGQGVPPAALVANPTTLGFNAGNGPAGVTLIGDTTTKTYTLTNTGTEPTGMITFTKSGTNQADYTFTSNCTTLPMNMSCTVTVTFTPTASGLKTAALLATATPGGSASVALSGDALPRLQITAPATNPFDFGNVIVKTTAAPTQTVTFRNNQQVAKTITLAALTNTTDYSIVSTNCNASVAANGTCDAIVKFNPQSPGLKTATLNASVGPGAADTAAQVFNGTGVNSLTIAGTSNPPTVTCTTGAGATCDFGNVGLGTVSGTLTITVTNPAGAPTASSISTTLSNTDFQIVSDNCAAQSLNGGSSCTIIAQFQPTGATGLKTGVLTVTASPAGGSTSLTLTGTATPGANLTFAPDPTLAFGPVFSGENSDKTITVTNTGGVASGVLTFSKTGTGPYTLNQGAAQAGDCVSGTTVLAAGGTCTVRVRFSPTGTTFGAAAATGVHFSTAGNVGLPSTGHDVAFTGTSVSTISIAPTPFSFGTTLTTNSTTTKTFVVTNDSNTGVTIPTAVITPANTDTTITSNMCSSAGVVAAKATCTITVQFAPGVVTGDFARTLTVNSTNGTAVATMTAHVLTPASIAWSPMSADLGSTLAGSTNGASQAFTLTNSGETAAPLAVAISDTADYTLSANTCTASLAGNSSCSVTVKFTPPAAATVGTKPATLTATATGPTASITAAVITSGGLVITPPTSVFPDTLTGSTSTPNTFTIQNTSALTQPFTVATTGQFAVGTATGCGTSPNFSLATGAQCTITATFKPTTAGAQQGTLQVTGLGNPYSALSGNGLTPASLTVNPTSNNYGMVAVGDSGSATFTVTNGGGVTAAPLSTSALGGADPGSFQISADGCAGKSLAAGASCTIVVKFQPQGVGSKSSSFVISSTSLSGGMQAISLTGTGVLQAILGITPSTGQSVAATAVGANGATTTFAIRNGGDVSTGPLTIGLSNSADYTILNSSTCVAGAALASGATCNVDIRFNPTNLGTDNTTLTVSAPAGPGTTQVTNTITGQGTSTITVAPTSNDYGTVTNHMASASATFTFTNNAITSTGVLHTLLGGTDSTQFSIVTDNCAGKTLAAAATCTIDVRFTPQTTGSKSATLQVTGATGTPTATLTGLSN